MKRILLSILLALTFAVPAQAAHAAPKATRTATLTATTFRVYTDPSAAQLPVGAAVTAWDKARNVTVVPTSTSCTGTGCIRVVMGTDWSRCGTLCTEWGYATPQADGSCVVFVQSFAQAWSYVTAHEIGHCMGLGHVTTDRRSVMQEAATNGVTGPDTADLRRLGDLYA